MKELYPMRGVITTVITPFTLNNKVDISSLKNEISAACEAGVAGFLVPCLASEIFHLSTEECDAITKAVVDVAKGRAKVIAGITSNTQEERLAKLRKYIDMGCDGVNAMIPYTNDDEYRRYVEEIDAQRPPFLCIQDADFNGPGLHDDLIVKLFNEVESFKVIKIEVASCGPKYSRIIKATGGRLNISSGWGNDQMIEAFDRGIHSIMPSGMFELYTGVYKLYTAGNREAAKRLFYDILPIIAFTRQGQAINRKFHKRYLKAMGIFETDLSREPVAFDEYHQRYADELIQRAKDIIARLDS
jgi:Dihydrodipicolinate synthase/N-acetylneuraminate lyase